jgi:hypothetical protein
MTSPIVLMYVKAIQQGRITIDAVPERYRAEVEELLVE